MNTYLQKTAKIVLAGTLYILLFLGGALANPGKKTVKLGFIPLTDCAPLVIAKEMGFFAKYGVDVQLSKEASWAVIRDKILNGELDAAHCLFSMPFSVYTGIGGKAGSEMKITIREIVEVPLKRPRNKKEIVHDPKYMEIHDRLLGLLIDKFSIDD